MRMRALKTLMPYADSGKQSYRQLWLFTLLNSILYYIRVTFLIVSKLVSPLCVYAKYFIINTLLNASLNLFKSIIYKQIRIPIISAYKIEQSDSKGHARDDVKTRIEYANCIFSSLDFLINFNQTLWKKLCFAKLRNV